MTTMILFVVVVVVGYVVSDFFQSVYGVAAADDDTLRVPLTLVQGAADNGAVCLDGSLPGYHLDRGCGAGANSWLILLEGGGWCNDIASCEYRKHVEQGSSNSWGMVNFTGILSDKAEKNPDFFNWNRVKLRYCDGASFAGDSEDKDAQLEFKGQRIWSAAIEDLMSMGMRNADQALLSGCSAGGLASILHCDEFRRSFPTSTKVKCLSDAGLFLDVVDASGERTIRNLFGGVVNMQRLQKNLPSTCTDYLDPISCFFPENLIANVETPLFILNPAYDTWQVLYSLAPPSVDHKWNWSDCRRNIAKCSTLQIEFLQEFRNQMLRAIREFSTLNKNGFFINSCFAHCQTEIQDTWYADGSPLIGNQGIALAVGNWYFDRGVSKAIDCAYPCDKTCPVFN